MFQSFGGSDDGLEWVILCVFQGCSANSLGDTQEAATFIIHGLSVQHGLVVLGLQDIGLGYRTNDTTSMISNN
jgi:hypothetical protein